MALMTDVCVDSTIKPNAIWGTGIHRSSGRLNMKHKRDARWALSSRLANLAHTLVVVVVVVEEQRVSGH